MTTDKARTEYSRICDDILELMMSGVPEDDPVIVALKEAAHAIAVHFNIYEWGEEEEG